MSSSTRSAAQTSVEKIREELSHSLTSEGAAAQVFFNESVTEEGLGDVALEAIRKASGRLKPHKGGKSARSGKPAVTVSRVNPLSRSVAVRGDAAVIAEMLREDVVKTVLPSVQSDIFPRPAKVERRR